MDYQNPLIAETYDLANPLGEDAEFYLSLAGERACRILDLGCGTGTLCCGFARLGHQVTGTDPAAAMLAVARRKPYAERVEWVECPAQNYRSGRRFDLIVMTGHAFQILLTDDDALAVFETMRIHLDGGGSVAFETRNPRLDWAGEWGARETLEITSAADEFISFRTHYRFGSSVLTTDSTLRFPSRKHLEELLGRAGLAVRDVFGDWHAGPFEAARSREMIFVARMAG